MLRALVITYYFPPAGGGGVQRDADQQEAERIAAEHQDQGQQHRDAPLMHQRPEHDVQAEVGVRADRVIRRVLQAGGDVAVFAHGHLLRTLGARWMRLAPEAGGALALGTAALCDLGFERERRVVWTWNDTSHGGGR